MSQFFLLETIIVFWMWHTCVLYAYDENCKSLRRENCFFFSNICRRRISNAQNSSLINFDKLAKNKSICINLQWLWWYYRLVYELANVTWTTSLTISYFIVLFFVFIWFLRFDWVYGLCLCAVPVHKILIGSLNILSIITSYRHFGIQRNSYKNVEETHRYWVLDTGYSVLCKFIIITMPLCLRFTMSFITISFFSIWNN